MAHPLVNQLRFTRSEWLRALEGVTEEDACKRLLPMNSIGWMVGHLAWQESRQSWLLRVERLGHDILLDRLPWTISVVKLPWMDEMVQVEW